jgi:hypothetical protein
MAKKSRGEGPNKSEAIRAYTKKNADAGPTEVAAALAKDGIEVTAAFVSTVLSNDRRKSGKSGKRGGKGRGRAAAASTGASLEHLIEAKKLIQKMGGIDEARQAINLLAKILDS